MNTVSLEEKRLGIVTIFLILFSAISILYSGVFYNGNFVFEKYYDISNIDSYYKFDNNSYYYIINNKVAGTKETLNIGDILYDSGYWYKMEMSIADKIYRFSANGGFLIIFSYISIIYLYVFFIRFYLNCNNIFIKTIIFIPLFNIILIRKMHNDILKKENKLAINFSKIRYVYFIIGFFPLFFLGDLFFIENYIFYGILIFSIIYSLFTILAISFFHFFYLSKN